MGDILITSDDFVKILYLGGGLISCSDRFFNGGDFDAGHSRKAKSPL
jgi:hypothetical protein